VSNACSGEPGEIPDEEVNAHLGNPGLDYLPALAGSPMPVAPGAGGSWRRSTAMSSKKSAPTNRSAVLERRIGRAGELERGYEGTTRAAGANRTVEGFPGLSDLGNIPGSFIRVDGETEIFSSSQSLTSS
jgi:hypothetical protein